MCSEGVSLALLVVDVAAAVVVGRGCVCGAVRAIGAVVVEDFFVGFHEGRVVIELRVHVLFEFGERHLEHVYLQHLLLRQTLHLLQLLFLGLY